MKAVCNHSKYEPADRLFDVKWQYSDIQSNPTDPLVPETVYSRLAGHRRTNALQVTWAGSASEEVILSLGQQASGTMMPITGKHLMAFFVLMTRGSEVVLVNKPKPGWSHDVPGGKVTVADRSGLDTVQREVFEELGLLLEENRLEGPIGALYDHRSAKERGIPVIAHYFHYPLDNREYKYLFGAAKATTKGECLVPYPLLQLLDEKEKNAGPLEAVCHASLAVIERIVTRLAQN